VLCCYVTFRLRKHGCGLSSHHDINTGVLLLLGLPIPPTKIAAQKASAMCAFAALKTTTASVDCVPPNDAH
jgi:hypothetical protein